MMLSPYDKAIQGMSDVAAAGCLLDLLNKEFCNCNQRKSDVLHHLGHPSIPPTPLALFICLWDRRGRVVTHDTLANVAERESNLHGPCVLSLQIASHVKRIRNAAKRYNWPVKITPQYSIGYRLEVLAPGWTIEPETKHQGTIL